MDELVSVIIPCYNQGSYVAQAIESVLHQSYAAFEIVVINDGSKDDTAEVCARYPIVRYLSKKNGGLSAARNTGISNSRGELLVFLDADDRLLPHAIQVGAAYLQERPSYGFAFGHCVNIGPDGSPLKTPPQRVVDEDYYSTLLKRNYIWNPASVMYRRSVLGDTLRFDTTLTNCEDYDIYLRITRRFPVGFHGQVVAEYRRHPGNKSRNAVAMLNTVMGLLDREEQLNLGDEYLATALRYGRQHYKEFYGNKTLEQLQALIAEKGSSEKIQEILRTLKVRVLS